MRNSIRFKFILGLSLIFIIGAVVLNILIRQVFQHNLENSIKSSMKDVMKNSREYIKYNISSKDLQLDEKVFSSKISDRLNSSVLTYGYEFEIRTPSGKAVESTMNSDFSELVDKGSKAATEGKAVINLKYSGDNLQGILSYPLYYGNKCLAIINISKSFGNEYDENKRKIHMITLIEFITFIFIFISSYLFTSKIVKPIMMLTKQIKKIEEGNYEISLEIKSTDEIGVLLKEFMSMKEKIKNQIKTIKAEKDKVVKLEKGRREFFNNVTHELKTPLTAISGYAQILADENVKDEEFRARAVQRIYLESERLHKFVLDLINVSKGISFLKEDKKKIDMKKLIYDICEDMKIKADKYSISLITKIEEGFIFAQENKIRQLIINLIDNAIKYSFQEESVYVKAFIENETYKIEILNRGNSIPKEIYNSLFEPFVKGDNSIETGSSGLGLYICNEIVKEHNGEIYIENGNVMKVIVKIPSFLGFGNNLETT